MKKDIFKFLFLFSGLIFFSLPLKSINFETQSSGTATPIGPAGNDLSGNYPNPSITEGAVDGTELADIITLDAPLSIVSGNVSIGTTTESGRLHVDASTTTIADRNILQLTNNGGSRIQFTNTDNGNSWVFSVVDNGFRLSKVLSGVTEFHINDAGEMGLGVDTVDALSKVDINAGTKNVRIFGNVAQMFGLVLENKDQTANSESILSLKLKGNDSVTNDSGRIVSGKEQLWTSDPLTRDGYISFHTRLDNSINERVRISSSGFVGINTSTPIGSLHVINNPTLGESFIDRYFDGTATSGLVIRRARNTIDSPSAVISNDGVSGIKSDAYDGTQFDTISNIKVSAQSISAGDVSAKMEFLMSDTSGVLQNRMTIDENGYVGISTPTPKATLHLNGRHVVEGSAETIVDPSVGLTITKKVMHVKGNAVGNNPITATPNITNCIDDEEIELIGTDDANRIEFQDDNNLVGSGLKLYANSNFVLGRGDVLRIRCDSLLGVGIELSRSDN